MKCLSIRNPHASLLVRGPKDIETRNWRTHYRGEIAIHVSKTVCWDSILIFLEHEKYKKLGRLDVPTGAVIAKGQLLDIVEYTNKDEFDRDYNRHLLDSRFYEVTKYGWIISDIVPFLKPIPISGRQGLFNIDISLDRLIKEKPKQMCLADLKT